MEKRIVNILTEDELQKVIHLKKEIMRSSTKIEIRYFRYEFDRLIETAKERYYNS